MMMTQAPGDSRADPEVERRVFSVVEGIDANSVGPLRQRLLEHLDAYGPRIWIDLSGVDFIDSTGLGALVALLREARIRGGDVRLLRPNRQVRRILQITGLEAIFAVESGPT